MEDKEKVRECISLLMDHFWFTRKFEVEMYTLIRQNRKEIQKYFNDNFGYQLIVNNAVVKLEKIPSNTTPWMGIQEFSDKLDYAIFTAVLSYLEDKSSDDIFIVSMLSEYVKQFLIQDIPIKWEMNRHRLSFVRAVKLAEKYHLLEVMEGEIDLYKEDETVEVLYRPTMVSKYFMRFFSKPIREFKTKQELLEDRWKTEGFETSKTRRQSISRKLLSSPVVYWTELDDEEKRYFANYGYSILDSFETYSPYEVETYRNEILLISKERNTKNGQYPDGRMISQISLQLSVFIHKKVEELAELPEFEWEIPRFIFENWVEELKVMNGHGWSKEYRDKYPEVIAKELVQYLQEWRMLQEDSKAHSIILYPLITRIGGRYPIEYHFQRYFIQHLKETMEMNFHEMEEYVLPMETLEDWVQDFKQEFEVKVFTPKKIEESIGGFVTLDDDRNICVVDMKKVLKKDAG